MKRTIHLEDGRLADQITAEEVSPSGEIKTITEIYEEPRISKVLSKRTINYSRPVVYRREHETVDATGEVVSRTVESKEPEVRLELREQIQAASVSAMSVESPCYVTQEDMQQAFVDGFSAVVQLLRNSQPVVSAKSVIENRKDKNDDWLGTVLWAVVAVVAAVFLWLVF